MKDELEVKILDVNIKKVRQRLRELGAHETFDGVLNTASYEIDKPSETPVYLLQAAAGGRFILVDHQKGELFESDLSSYEEAHRILYEIGMEEHNQAFHLTKRTQTLQSRDVRLRLRERVEERKSRTYGELTLKERLRRDTVKRMLEYEVTVSAYKDVRSMLLRIGMREERKYQKRRNEFELPDGISVVFDTLPDIPTWAEVEAPTEELIKQTVEAIGYTMTDTVPLRGSEVRELYRKRRSA